MESRASHSPHHLGDTGQPHPEPPIYPGWRMECLDGWGGPVLYCLVGGLMSGQMGLWMVEVG